MFADQLERISSIAYVNIQTLFQLSEILVEGTAKNSQSPVIIGFKIDVGGNLRRWRILGQEECDRIWIITTEYTLTSKRSMKTLVAQDLTINHTQHFLEFV